MDELLERINFSSEIMPLFTNNGEVIITKEENRKLKDFNITRI